MESKPLPDADVTYDSPGTKCWFLTPKECSFLQAHRMARVGSDDSRAGYKRVRIRPSGSFFMETSVGEGRVLLEGKWQKLGKGDVAMAPPRVLNAFYTPAGRHWVTAFVRYDEPPSVAPLIASRSPMRVSGHSGLTRAIEGLREEWEKEREPAVLCHWLAIIDAIARRLALPWKKDDRLAELWDDVSRDLTAAWTLDRLAKRSGFSAEHLRRMCLKTFGRSPMEQLTYIRIQRAQVLLEAGGEKIDAVARLVGYSCGHAFSRAFHRCVGLLPSEFRVKA